MLPRARLGHARGDDVCGLLGRRNAYREIRRLA
jgi:hypothetical protein